MPGSGSFVAFLYLSTTFSFCQELFSTVPKLLAVGIATASRRSVSLSASCARYDLPCLGYVGIVSHILPKVKHYFRFFRKCFFLTLTRWEPFCGCSSRLRLHAPFSASLCPSSPLAVAVGGHGLARPSLLGGFLTCSAVSIHMRLCRCIPLFRRGGRSAVRISPATRLQVRLL